MVGYPFVVLSARHDSDDIAWCFRRFDSPSRSLLWDVQGGSFFFKNRADAQAFARAWKLKVMTP